MKLILSFGARSPTRKGARKEFLLGRVTILDRADDDDDDDAIV